MKTFSYKLLCKLTWLVHVHVWVLLTTSTAGHLDAHFLKVPFVPDKVMNKIVSGTMQLLQGVCPKLLPCCPFHQFPQLWIHMAKHVGSSGWEHALWKPMILTVNIAIFRFTFSGRHQEYHRVHVFSLMLPNEIIMHICTLHCSNFLEKIWYFLDLWVCLITNHKLLQSNLNMMLGDICHLEFEGVAP